MISTDQEFHRFTIAFGDFEEALIYLDEAEAHHRGSTAHQALLCMAIICYARPFSPNERISTAKAKSGLCPEELGIMSAFEKGLHDALVAVRNKCIAHSEYDQNLTAFTSMGQIQSRRFSIYEAQIDASQFRNLVRARIDACHCARAPYAVGRKLKG